MENYFKMKTINLYIFIILLPLFLSAQKGDTIVKNKKNNSVYVEFLGNGLVLSLNYERILYNGPVNFGVRGGLGYSPEDGERAIYTIPFEIVVIFGNKKHHIELGAGISYYLKVNKSKHYHDNRKHTNYSIMVYPRIGYRYKGNKGLLIRVGYTPVLELPALDLFDKPFHPFGGISIGYSF